MSSRGRYVTDGIVVVVALKSNARRQCRQYLFRHIAAVVLQYTLNAYVSKFPYFCIYGNEMKTWIFGTACDPLIYQGSYIYL